MREAVLRFRIERVLVRGEHVGVRIEPVAIGANAIDVFDETDARRLGSANAVAEPLVGVAHDAVLPIERGAAGGARAVDRVRIRRRRQRPDPVAHALDAGVIDRHRRHTRAERGAQVALVHGIVVAVPMQVHPFARLLIPQRREVGGANQLVVRQPIELPVELNGLVRIEGVDAPAAPARHPVAENRRDAVAQLKRLQLQTVDQPEPQQRALEQGDGDVVLLETSAHGVGGHAVVERTLEHELDEALQIELMRRHPQHDSRLRVG